MSNNSAIQAFQFQATSLRVETDEHGNPLFCAKDVCDILGYANSRDIIKKFCREAGVSNRYVSHESGAKQASFIDEGNLYRLIIKSNKPESEPFEAWVCDEVLPAIRKTGGYGMPDYSQPITTPITLEEFETRHAFHTNALAQLKTATVTMTVSGADCLTMSKNFQNALQGKFTEKALEFVFGSDKPSKLKRTRWTQFEIDALRAYRDDGYTAADIAKKLNRTTDGVRNAAYKYAKAGTA